MTPSDDIFAKKITTYLDHGMRTSSLGSPTACSWRGPRPLLALPIRSALRRVRALPSPMRAAGPEPRGGGRGFWASGWLWVGIALIVAAGFGFQQWQAYQQLYDIEETDAAILSSDLPIDAYLDRGFQNWLKHARYDE